MATEQLRWGSPQSTLMRHQTNKRFFNDLFDQQPTLNVSQNDSYHPRKGSYFSTQPNLKRLRRENPPKPTSSSGRSRQQTQQFTKPTPSFPLPTSSSADHKVHPWNSLTSSSNTGIKRGNLSWHSKRTEPQPYGAPSVWGTSDTSSPVSSSPSFPSTTAASFSSSSVSSSCASDNYSSSFLSNAHAGRQHHRSPLEELTLEPPRKRRQTGNWNFDPLNPCIPSVSSTDSFSIFSSQPSRITDESPSSSPSPHSTLGFPFEEHEGSSHQLVLSNNKWQREYYKMTPQAQQLFRAQMNKICQAHSKPQARPSTELVLYRPPGPASSSPPEASSSRLLGASSDSSSPRASSFHPELLKNQSEHGSFIFPPASHSKQPHWSQTSTWSDALYVNDKGSTIELVEDGENDGGMQVGDDL